MTTCIFNSHSLHSHVYAEDTDSLSISLPNSTFKYFPPRTQKALVAAAHTTFVLLIRIVMSFGLLARACNLGQLAIVKLCSWSSAVSASSPHGSVSCLQCPVFALLL